MTWALGLLANRYARIGGAILLATVLLLLAVKCVRDDAAEEERARVEAEQVKAERVNAKAKEEASIRREADQTTISDTQKGRDDAIRTSDDPRVALACSRLRNAGTPAERLPEPCRPRR